MLSSLSIFITLIKSTKAPSKDDVIIIQKDLSTNEFCVSLKDSNDGTEKIQHRLTGMYHRRALDYVYILLKNLALDEDGYQSIQVDLPALPRILVSAEKMKDVYYREHFLEAIGDGLDNLENGKRVEEKPRQVGKKFRFSENPVRTHLFFDE